MKYIVNVLFQKNHIVTYGDYETFEEAGNICNEMVKYIEKEFGCTYSNLKDYWYVSNFNNDYHPRLPIEFKVSELNNHNDFFNGIIPKKENEIEGLY